MKPFQFFSILISLVATTTATAQTHPDCDNPMLLTNMDPVTIDSVVGEGVEDDLSGTCIAQEFSPTWFSWQIAQPGTLTFVLTPLDTFDDLDFAVFRFNDNVLCQEKILKRCMAAGENVGAPWSESLPCLGPTGLNLTETDFEENPGCSNGNNNFLKFLQCQAGENYALVVNNFTSSGQGFTLEWGGTATFSSNPAGINSPTREELGQQLSIGPNPTSHRLQVFGLESGKVMPYRIVDNLGRLVRSGQLQTDNRSLDVSMLVSGVYFMNLVRDDIQHVFKFVVE
ncbi:MAG: T9SS type A sorting domain-containing protein [Saprospiraceae bacterium]|nr:T9SS type A sorting domain-containing protein [Saprospiraceae bacterium]